MQTPDWQMGYEAFRLAGGIFRLVGGLSHPAKAELLASVSHLYASLAVLDSGDEEKLACCIDEANETEFWLDTCISQDLISEQEYLDCMIALLSIKSMLCALESVDLG